MSDYSKHRKADTPALNVPLENDEELRAIFHPDLDENLHYAQSLVVATSRRILLQKGEAFTSFPRTVSLTVKREEHAGVGDLRVMEGGKTLLRLRYTLA